LQTVFKLSFDTATATTGNPTTSIDRVHAHQQQESTDRLQIYRHHVLQPVQAVLFGRPRRKASPIRFASAKDNQIGADKKAQRAKAKNVKRIKTAVMGFSALAAKDTQPEWDRFADAPNVDT
jgi:hypothetical protein|tara:strand:+ start:669 stop:1034 length:366 start_codon:yes stop_codon:yes gene_type:complete